MNKWLLLNYKIPREPTARRVSTWRKLKQLGALLLHDSVWVLPATPRTSEQFQWLAAEIIEQGGDAMLWVTEALMPNQQQWLVEQFSTKTDGAYQEILSAIRKRNADLAGLGRAYQQAAAQDYFQSKLAEKARRALLAKGGAAS